jgi:hypothetical protein
LNFSLQLLILLSLVGCFADPGVETSGGGLFSNHVPVVEDSEVVDEPEVVIVPIENIFILNAPVNNYYNESGSIQFTLTHNAVVAVTGTPRVAFDLGGVTKYADYQAGSGSEALSFSYNIQSGDNDVDGIEVGSSIDLNSGTLKYTDNEIVLDATTDFDSISTPGVLVDTDVPEFASSVVPADGFYKLGDNLDFTVNISENVNVVGSPRIILDINGSIKYAVYLSGTGTSSIVFRYTVDVGAEDVSGVLLSSASLDLNSGTIKDTAQNDINLNLELNTSVPNMASVHVDGIIPVVAITSFPNITGANQLLYTISGTCSENSEDVVLDIGSVAKTVSCSSGAWTSGAVNVSGISDSASFVLKADHADVALNSATQATQTVDKNTTSPQVAITLSPKIDASNHTDYIVSGTCTENGRVVDVHIGIINILPNCSSGTWSTGNIDVSSLTNAPAITITADHSNAVPVAATQASVDVEKDTSGPTVTITSFPNISSGNLLTYKVSGTCSESGRVVDVNIGALNITPNCNSGSWTTGNQNVTSLIDGSISVTADHSNAVPVAAAQALKNISKNTSTPTVSSLSVSSTLKNSEDIAWSLVDPGGFTLNDYIVNYRIKGTGTWLTFSDGINLNVNSTVDSLNANTTYEFRVALTYDTTEQSAWSNIAEGETKPDDPLFDGEYKAMNVGGSTDTKVVAFYDNTVVKLNGTEIADSPLSKGQVSQITTAQFDVIEGDKAIYTAGRRGSGSDTAKANITWSPSSWAGKSFSFNATRYNPQQLMIYAVEDTTVTVKQGTTPIQTQFISGGTGQTISWSVYGSFQVNSTGTILAFHSSGSLPSRLVDPKPLLPSYNEIIGVPSSSMRITTDMDGTNYDLKHSDSAVTSGSMNKSDVISVNARGTTSYYSGYSLLISADRNIAGASFADANGGCAAPFLPTNLMRKNYIINTSADYVAFASKEPGTIEVKDSSDTVIETLTLVRSGADPDAPYKARRATTPQGYRFFSTVPMAGWYQPNSDVGAGDNDETILYGTDD